MFKAKSNRNIIFSFGVLCLSTLVALKDPREETNQRPIAPATQELHVPESIEFPAVAIGESVERQLEIVNTSSSSVVIFKVEASCGCTRVASRKTTLAPQQVAQFQVTVRGVSYSAMAGDKALRVTTSIGEFYVKVLTHGLKGMVVSPNSLEFGTISHMSLPATREVKIFTAEMPNQQRLSAPASCIHPCIDLSPIKFNEQGIATVSATIHRSPLSGFIWTEIEFSADGVDNTRSFVTARVEGLLVSKPRAVVVKNGTSGILNIASSETARVKIVKVTASRDLERCLKCSIASPSAVECFFDSHRGYLDTSVIRGYVTIDAFVNDELAQLYVPVTAVPQ